MLIVSETTVFRRDVKRAKRRGKDAAKLYAVVEKMAKGEPLAARHRPHALSGNWSPNWECHIEPDWVLIYEATDILLILLRTGTHSDFF